MVQEFADDRKLTLSLRRVPFRSVQGLRIFADDVSSSPGADLVGPGLFWLALCVFLICGMSRFSLAFCAFLERNLHVTLGGHAGVIQTRGRTPTEPQPETCRPIGAVLLFELGVSRDALAVCLHPYHLFRRGFHPRCQWTK